MRTYANVQGTTDMMANSTMKDDSWEATVQVRI